MNTVIVNNGFQLLELGKEPFLCWMGPDLTDSILHQIEEYLTSYDIDISDIRYYIIAGKTMNDFCKLTGTLRFAENSSIVVVSGISYENKLSFEQLSSFGGRFFNEVLHYYSNITETEAI